MNLFDKIQNIMDAIDELAARGILKLCDAIEMQTALSHAAINVTQTELDQLIGVEVL